MSEILSMLSGGWSWVVGAGAVALILVGSWFTGKKVCSTQTQAKADVTAATKEEAQVQAVAETQAKNIEVAKNVQQENASLTDAATRDKLRKSKYNSDD